MNRTQSQFKEKLKVRKREGLFEFLVILPVMEFPSRALTKRCSRCYIKVPYAMQSSRGWIRGYDNTAIGIQS